MQEGASMTDAYGYVGSAYVGNGTRRHEVMQVDNSYLTLCGYLYFRITPTKVAANCKHCLRRRGRPLDSPGSGP